MTVAGNAVRETSGRVGRLVDRAYERWGWQLFPGFMALAWLVLIVLIVPSVLNLGASLHATAAHTDELLLITLLLCLFCLAAVIALAIALCAPLRRFLRQDPGVSAENVWASVLRLPTRLIVASVALLMLVLFPIDALSAIRTMHLPRSMYPNALTGMVVMAGMTAAVAAFALSIVIRPVLRDLAPHLATPASPRTGRSLRWELRGLVPLVAVLTGATGAGLAAQNPESPGQTLARIGVATLVSAAVSVPGAYLLANSVLHPVGDLLAGAERLKRGDYSTPVPTVVPDELAAVAHAFNESMVGLAERARLAEETQQLLDDVRASRMRLVEAGDEARRRIERDIHDGVQQRIVGLGIVLGLLEDDAESLDREDLTRRLHQAHDELLNVLAELRELARGQFPTVIESDGLDAAVKQLAAKSPIPVVVRSGVTRLPHTIETTAYFVIAEALANAAKYAEATTAEVQVRVEDAQLTVRVRDDGRGGAQPRSGSGLAGLADRLAAVDGRLVVDSPHGDGTTLTAVIPLDHASR